MVKVALNRSQLPDNTATASEAGKSIFIVSHVFPYPPLGGHELRVIRLMKWLRSEGYRVVFVLSTEIDDGSDVKQLRQFADDIYWVTPPWWTRLGKRLPGTRRVIWEHVKPLVARAWLRFLNSAETGSYPSIPSNIGNKDSKRAISSPRLATFVSRLARSQKAVGVIAEYIFLTDCFSLLPPDVLKIIDTIDVFSLKDSQVVSHGIDEPWTCTPEEERAYLLRGDVILAIQNREASILKELVPEREVITVGIDYDVPASIQIDGAIPNIVTVVGSDNPKNVHGLRSFITECWPAIKAAHPSAVLNVVGRVGRLGRVDNPAINYLMEVESLSDIYRRSRVVINPSVAGTGLKIKSVEALAHGRPLVAWPRGVEGLDYDGEAPYVKCESWKEFAGAVVRILRSDSEAQAMGERALAYARLRFDPAIVYAQLKTRLAEQRSAETGSTVKVEQLASASPTYSADDGHTASV